MCKNDISNRSLWLSPRAPGWFTIPLGARVCVLIALATTLASGPVHSQARDQEGESAGDGPAAVESAQAAAANETPAPPMDPLVEDANERGAEMAAIVGRYAALEETLGSTKGEQRGVLLGRMSEMRLDYLDKLHDQADNLLAQREKGIEAAEFERKIAVQMPRALARLGELIVETELQIQRARTPLEEVGPAQDHRLQQIALQNTRTLDALYQGMSGHLDRMERLGLADAVGSRWLIEHLERRADSLAGWVRHLDNRISSLEDELAASPEDSERKSSLSFEQNRLETITTSFDLTLKIMRGYDLETAEYRRLLIETTGEITGDILDSDVGLRLLRDWSDRFREWVEENGPTALFKLVLFVAILLVARLVARLTRLIVKRAVMHSRLGFSKLLQDTSVSLASTIVMFLGLLVALTQVGVDPGPVLAGLGLAGFIVGFALQDTLGNFASGAMILAYRPYDVGDLVEAGGVFGRVSKMSLVSTTILTIDNQTLIVPNAKIWENVIKNVTDQVQRRVDLEFAISYDDDLEHAERVFASILEADERVLADPAPLIVVNELGDSGIIFKVCPWVRTADYWNVYWDLTRTVKLRFDQEGLHIPLPRTDVHLQQKAGSPSAPGRAAPPPAL